MVPLVYTLGSLVSLCCTFLLFRGYARVKKPLLLWSGLCFLGLTLSNLLVFVDLELLPTLGLFRVRLVTAGISILLLLYGLIWESE